MRSLDTVTSGELSLSGTGDSLDLPPFALAPTGMKRLAYNSVADRPVISVPASETIGNGKTLAISGVSVTDASDPGGPLTLYVNVTEGLLFASGNNVSGAMSDQLTLSGSLVEVNADLATLEYVGFPPGTDTIGFALQDSLGNTAANTIAVTVNSGPSIIAPELATIATGQASPITGVSLAESGATDGESFTVEASDTNGLLAATGAGVSGSGSTLLTISGSLAQVNSDLATLQDTDPASGSDAISFFNTDSFGNVSPGSVFVQAIPKPEIIAPAGVTIGINEYEYVFDFGLTKFIPSLPQTPSVEVFAEPGAPAGETFNLLITDSNGGLQSNPAITGDFSPTYIGFQGSPSHPISVTGLPLAAVNDILAALVISEPMVGTDSLVIRISGSLGDEVTSTIAVHATPSLVPILTAPTEVNVLIGQSTPIGGVSIAELNSAPGEQFVLSLHDSAGLLSVHVPSSSPNALELDGTLDQVNTDLASLQDADSSLGSDTIYISGYDIFGNQISGSIFVQPSPQPGITAPASVTLTVGRFKAVPGIGFAENGALANETFNVLIVDTYGTLFSNLSTNMGSSDESFLGLPLDPISITGLSLSDLNQILGSVGEFESKAGSDSIVITVGDSLGDQATSTISVISTLSLDLTAPATATVTLGQSNKISGITLLETGSEPGETFTIVATDGHGLLSATGAGVSGAASKALTITGSLAQVNTELATLTDTDTAAGSDTINLSATDSFGNVADNAISVNARLQLEITAPATMTIGLGTGYLIPGISVAEPGATAGEIFNLLVTDTDGYLLAGGPEGNEYHGSRVDPLSVTGLTLPDLNDLVSSLSVFEPTAGTDAIVISVNDSLGGEATATIAVTASFNQTSQPFTTAPATQTVTLGQPTAIEGVSLGEIGNLPGETFTIVATDGHGLLSATGAGVSGSATKALTITGSLAQVNTELATLTDVDGTAGPDSITLTAIDSYGNTEGYDNIGASTIAVTAIAPVLVAPSIAGAVAGQTLGSGSSIKPFASVTITDSNAGQAETLTITESNAAHGILSDPSGAADGSSLRNGVFNVSGSALDVSNIVDQLIFTPSGGQPPGTSLATGFTIAVEDTAGLTASNTATSVVAIAPAAASRPVITAPTVKSLVAGTATAIAGVSLAESPTASGESFTVRLADTYGLLSATGTGVSGSGSKALTITGSLARVNADLKTLAETDLTAGADGITLSATDSLGAKATPVSIAVTASSTIGTGMPVYIYSGETASTLTIGNGGIEFVAPGGKANGNTLDKGGLQTVFPAGTTDHTVIDGGLAFVTGTANNTRVNNGGSEAVGLGGVSFDTTIQQGGDEYVLPGGYANNTTIATGGIMDVSDGGNTAGSINFAGSDAALVLDGKTLPSTVISGFDQSGATGDAIILTAFTYAAGHDHVSLGTGNVLTLDLDGVVQKLNLNPSQSYVGHSFSAIADSQDQVVIVDPTTFSAPKMEFLAPAAEPGDQNAMVRSLEPESGLFLNSYENARTTAAFLPTLRNFAAIDALDTSPAIGSSLAALNLPNTILSVINKLTLHPS